MLTCRSGSDERTSREWHSAAGLSIETIGIGKKSGWPVALHVIGPPFGITGLLIKNLAKRAHWHRASIATASLLQAAATEREPPA